MNSNPPSKDIDVTTEKGLELLKVKAKYYGHYAEQLKVVQLIEQLEYHRDEHRRLYMKHEGPKII